MPGLDDAEQAFIDALVSAMESGAGGNKTTVATNIASAVKTFVKSGEVTVSTVTTCPAGAGTGTGSGTIS